MRESNIKNDIYKIIIFLLGIQLFRTIVFISMTTIFGDDVFTVECIKLCTIFFIGLILLIVVYKKNISLTLFFISNNPMMIMVYSIISVIVIFMIMTTPAYTGGYGMKVFIPFLYSVIIIPIFQELIFRGYFWNKLIGDGIESFKVIIITSVIFSFWYVLCNLDINGIINLATLSRKLIIGLIYGIILGGARFKSRNTFTCILCHSIMNMWIGI